MSLLLRRVAAAGPLFSGPGCSPKAQTACAASALANLDMLRLPIHYLLSRGGAAGVQCQIPQMPLLPNDAERHPTMVREYHAIAEEIRRECQHIALLDRMHSLKARPPAAFGKLLHMPRLQAQSASLLEADLISQGRAVLSLGTSQRVK